MQASAGLVVAFAGVAVIVAAGLVAGVYAAWRGTGSTAAAAHRAAGTAAGAVVVWMAVTFAAARAGALRFDGVPPTMPVLFVAIAAIGIGLGRSRIGERLATGLPLAALVGFQAFRLPLELAMHQAYVEGIMPVQMSYSGLNFDILTGIGAIVVALLLAGGRAPLWLVRGWNVMGTLLLVNILTVAWLSAPTPLRVFMNEPANVWVSQAPWVWLPSVMVLSAILGHVVLFRRLAVESRKAVSAERVTVHAGA